MNVWIGEESERVLRALNGKKDSWGATRAYWNDEFRRQFREYVDAWLATGRESAESQNGKDYSEKTLGVSTKRFPPGTEVPAQRNLNHAPAVLKAVTAYLRVHRPAMLPPTQSGAILFVIGWAPSKSPAEEAARLLSIVVLSAQQGEWGAHIAKCRYAPCGRYFLMERLGRAYRNGTFCTREHNKLASAGACTRRRRQESDRSLIERAAHSLRALKVADSQWQGDRSLKQEVVLRLNRHLMRSAKQQHRQTVTLNWITRNSNLIEGVRLLLIP
jgi:hypothetical protein